MDAKLTILALLITALYLFSKIRKFRYKTAFRFGRIEHRFARITFAFLILTFIFLLLEADKLALYSVVLAGACWMIYWASHRLEKWFHPRH